MKKDTYWFPHDSNASSDPKIIALVSVYGMEGKGRYWTVIEILRDQSGYRYDISKKFGFTSLADALKMSLQECQKFIGDLVEEFELLKQDDQFIWSESLLRRMSIWDEKKRRMSERGKKGAKATNEKNSAKLEDQAGTSGNFSGTSEKNGDNKRIGETGETEEREVDGHSPSNDPKKRDQEIYYSNLKERFPRLFSMAEPLTLKELALCQQKIFIQKNGQALFEKVLRSMNDYEDIGKRRSTFQLMLRWIQNENQDQSIIQLAGKEHFLKFISEREYVLT